MLKGRLNKLQVWALSAALRLEREESSLIEENRIRYIVAATNPVLYGKLFPGSIEEEDNIEWRTPQSAEEADTLMEILASTHKGSETLISDPIMSEIT